MRYPHKNVILVEKDPYIAGTWKYLLNTTPEEILKLPNIALDQSVDDLKICEEEKWLIGWWLMAAASKPNKRPSGWMRRANLPGCKWHTVGSWWGDKIKQRIAQQIPLIQHWKLIEGDYSDAPDMEATWFVDPPYQVQGKSYTYGSKLLEYNKLASWCLQRKGLLMVCEQQGATWLPFAPFREIRAATKKGGVARVSKEVLFLKDST